MRSEGGIDSGHGSDADSGFSLIEVLVTLVIISVVLIPIYQMQQTLDRSSVRLQRSTALIVSSGTVLSFISSINPMVTPKGSQVLANLNLEWESEEVDAFLRSGTVADPAKRIALYDLTYTIKDADGRSLETKTIKKMGWEESPPPS